MNDVTHSISGSDVENQNKKTKSPLLYFLDTFERAVLKLILCSEKLQIIARVLIIFFFFHEYKIIYK